LNQQAEPVIQVAVISNVVYIVLVLLCIGFSWYGIQQLRLDVFLRNPRSGAARLLQVFVSIALGYQVARFIIDYVGWSMSWSGLAKLMSG
jgi:uncharacterized integral membrane protein (TIGR02327 family)